MIIIAVVAVLIIIGVIVALKNKSSADGADTGPQAHVDSVSDSAQQAADVSAAAASAAANASTPQEAAAATQQAVAAGAVAQQAAASSAQTAQQVSSGTPVPSVDCVLNDWDAYGPCIADSTGKYFKTRLRTIKVQPSGNGKACESLVDKTECPGTGSCAEFGPTTVPSAEKPIPLACHQDIWKKYCSKPLVESDWVANYRTLPHITTQWLDDDAKARSTSATWKSHCNLDDSCAGFTAGSTTKPIPLACHQQIWKKYCSKPLVESDWVANYRTLPVVTVDWLDADAKVRSTSATWKSHCN